LLEDQDGETAPQSRAYVVVWAVVVVAHVAAFWASTYPPLVDYPNHLSRAFILSRYDESASFHEAFVPDWKVTPYLGADLLMALLSFLDPRDAGRVVLSVCFVVFAAGCVLLGYALHGRRTWSSVAAAFVFLNPAFLYGFLSYILGLGLFLCTAAAFLRLSPARRPSFPVQLGLALLALLCYFCHLHAFTFLCLAVAALVAWRIWRREPWGRASALLLLLLPALVYHLLLMGSLERSLFVPHWGGVLNKLKGLDWVGVSVVPELDLVAAGLLMGVVLVSSRSGGLQKSGLGVALSALFLTTYFVLPVWPYGWSMDQRFLIPASVLLIVSLEPTLARPRRWLMAGALLALLGRPLCYGFNASRLSATIGEQVELLRTLPHASRVFPIVSARDQSLQNYELLAMRHVGHYATIEREAIVSTQFVSGVDWLPNWIFPLRWRSAPPVGQLSPDQALVQDIPWALIFRHSDFVYAYDLRPAHESVLRRNCRLLDRRGKGVLYGRCRPETRPAGSSVPARLGLG
jgi:hypothetical protein